MNMEAARNIIKIDEFMMFVLRTFKPDEPIISDTLKFLIEKKKDIYEAAMFEASDIKTVCDLD